MRGGCNLAALGSFTHSASRLFVCAKPKYVVERPYEIIQFVEQYLYHPYRHSEDPDPSTLL